MARASSGHTSTPPNPPTLPDLKVVQHVGTGGYGHVWLARNRVTHALVAVKTIHLEQDQANTRAAREIGALIRFEAEVRSPHENLVTIHHVGRTDDVIYYTMDPAEDVSGEAASADPSYRPRTLEALLAKGPLDPDACLRYTRQLLSGVAHLHEKGLAHRDIKPANCLFVDGVLKLADFGLITQTEGSASLVGTRPYMPPDGHMDSRADVYAAGLVVYEMLTGLPATAFPRWSREAVEAARQSTLVGRLNRVVLKACQADPNERYKDAHEMLDALELTEEPRRRAERRWLVAVALIAIAALAGAAATVLLNAHEPATRNVNFITHPFEAQIVLDGERVERDDGTPYTTPCTIPDLPGRAHEVVFRLSGHRDLVVGEVDFSKQQEVVAGWDEGATR